MTKENKPENEAQEEVTQSNNDNTYGPSLVIINTLIILSMVILAIAYKKGAFNNLEASGNVTEIIQAHAKEVAQEEEEIAEESEWVTPHISKQAKIHILYGDETGGAHYHTVKTPCKSLFPKNWNPDKIIEVTEKIAANDNLKWKPRRNGNMYAKDVEDGIIVGVIMNPTREHVITSFPLNADRNPCPSDNNDVMPAAGNNEETVVAEEKEEELFDKIDIEHKYQYNQ